MDALSPEISCLENAAFLGYNTCVIEGSTGVSCPGWSCAEIGVTLPDAGNSTDLGGGTSGELTGITEDSGSEVYDTDTTSVECPLETDACQSDPVCVECSGVVTEENDQEWESCINSVSTQDLCVGYGEWNEPRDGRFQVGSPLRRFFVLNEACILTLYSTLGERGISCFSCATR